MAVQLPAFIPSLGLNSDRLATGSTTYSLTGNTINLTRTRVVVASGGTFTKTGQDASFIYNQISGGASAPGFLPNFSLLFENSANKGIVAQVGNFIVTGQDVVFRRGRYITASGATFGFEGAPKESDFEIEGEFGTFTLTGTNIIWGRKFTAETASYSIPANDFTSFVRTQGNSPIMGGTQGFLVLSGDSAEVIKSIKIIAEIGTYGLPPQDITFGRGFIASGGTYSLTGQDTLFSRAASQARRLRIKFVTSRGSAVQGPITIDYAFFDQSRPSQLRLPIQKGTGTIDANGIFDIQIEGTTLGASQVGYLVLTNNTGNPELTWKEFSGPVRVT